MIDPVPEHPDPLPPLREPTPSQDPNLSKNVKVRKSRGFFPMSDDFTSPTPLYKLQLRNRYRNQAINA